MLRVTTETPDGQGYDLTPLAEGLRYSNVDPGGDDSCSFTYKGSWQSDQPEIAKRNILRVTAGLDELWRGQIEEVDRGADATEEVEVTAYGLGKRLSDVLMSAVYVDCDLSHWGPMSNARRVAFLTTFLFEVVADPSVDPDTSTGIPALNLSFQGTGGALDAVCEAQYDAGADNLISSIYADYTSVNTLSTYVGAIGVTSDDILTAYTSSADLLTGTNSSGTVTVTASTPYRFGFAQIYEQALTPTEATHSMFLRRLKVYGNTGLTATGTEPTAGFTADQIVGHALGQVSGITRRQVDGQSFVIIHFVADTPTPPGDVIEEANSFEPADYGTWGPDDVLSRDTNGYFDYTTRDTSTQHWFASRAEADDLDLHSELNTLFNKVRVIYEDAAGIEQSVTRTATVPDLGDEVRETTLDAGQSTQTDAQRLGDSFLALSGGFAPARGSVTFSQPIRHYRRGPLSPAYLRADGSNIRIPDVLPAETLFALDDTPDRRTTFPIRRVEVDASGEIPVVSVELDQANDDMTTLQARLALASQFGGGEASAGGGGGESSMVVGKAKTIRKTRKRKRVGKK